MHVKHGPHLAAGPFRRLVEHLLVHENVRGQERRCQKRHRPRLFCGRGHSAVGLAHQQALLLQVLHRLARGHLGHVERSGQLAFRRKVEQRIVAHGDPPLQNGFELI